MDADPAHLVVISFGAPGSTADPGRTHEGKLVREA
jgi:hypothetical protein